MMVLFWITVGIGGLWVVLFFKNLGELLGVPEVRPGQRTPNRPLPRVSVIIPVRDEESNITTCLRSLMAQDHPDLEIIVVDDGSSDRSPELVKSLAAEDQRIRLIHATEPPPGWTGKCHALSLGVQQGRPSGEWLLFTDADTSHHPQSIGAALEVALERSVDLITLIPHLEARSFWERLLQPTVAALIALFHRPACINHPKHPEAFANGQYILIRRQAYDKSGGHRAVAGKVLEDVELARAVVASGNRMFIAVARRILSTRMYTSLSSLVQGWTKNFYMIFGSRLSRVIAVATLALVLSLWPALFGVGALVALTAGFHPLPVGLLWVTVGIYALVLVFQFLIRYLNRWYPAYAPLAPLANLLTVFILLRSAWLHANHRGVGWKGRIVFDDQGGSR